MLSAVSSPAIDVALIVSSASDLDACHPATDRLNISISYITTFDTSTAAAPAIPSLKASCFSVSNSVLEIESPIDIFTTITTSSVVSMMRQSRMLVFPAGEIVPWGHGAQASPLVAPVLAE